MAITLELYPGLQLAVFRYDGEISVDDNFDTFIKYSESKAFQPSFHVLVDQSKGLFSEATFESMRQLAYLLQPYYAARAPESRTAFYSPSDVHFGVTRQYESTSQSYTERPVGVFRSLEECAECLFLDASDETVMNRLRGADTSSQFGTV